MDTNMMIMILTIVTIYCLYLIHKEAATSKAKGKDKELCNKLRLITSIGIAVIAAIGTIAEAII